MDGLQVRFWGTRGSGPAPFGNRMEYGGNTSCVSVRYDGGLAVFDAGTGIAALGRRLEEECRLGQWSPETPVHLFIGHLHLDHIQGLPLFSWLFQKGAKVRLYGMGNEEASFRQRISAVFGPPYWPVSIGQVPADISWHEIGPGETIEISGHVCGTAKDSGISGGARVRTLRADHPNGGILYRMELGGESVVYGLDCELGVRVQAAEEMSGRAAGSGAWGSSMWERYREFAKGCGLLIFDAPYTETEYPDFRGYGHSFWQQGLWMAKECGAKRLCICHHDWGRTDREIAAMERLLKEQAAAFRIRAEFAREER